MVQPKVETFSCDVFIEFDVDGSQVAGPPLPASSPPISPEKKEFLDTIDQFQRRYTGRSLNWGEIFDVLVSLGYRKVEQPVTPPESNGSSQAPARPDDAANETQP